MKQTETTNEHDCDCASNRLALHGIVTNSQLKKDCWKFNFHNSGHLKLGWHCDIIFIKMKVIWFFLLGHILKIKWFGFSNPHLFLKMSKFIAGHVIKMLFLKLWITSFLTQILHVNFKETVKKMMWYLLQQIWA